MRRRERPGRLGTEIEEVVPGFGDITLDSGLVDRQVKMNSSERYLKPEAEKDHPAPCDKRRFEMVSVDVLFHDGIGGLKPFDFGLQKLDLRVGRVWKKEDAA